jgi:hypothetical protein
VVVPTELTSEQKDLLKQLDATFRNAEQHTPKSILDRVRDALGV